MKRFSAIICLLGAGLILGACSSEVAYNGYGLTGVMPDLAFTLTSENGETVTAQAYAGKLRILFFGYTHCPDICPITLNRLRIALHQLPRPQRQQIRVLFVSVDPRRDTPARLRQYTSLFGPRFIGLTGTQEQLRALTKRYRVTYSYGEPNERGYYEVAHSSGMFVFGPEGRLHLLLNQTLTASQIAEDLRTLLSRT